MAFWGPDRWNVANAKLEIVEEFNQDLVKDGCYRLAVGGEAIVSSSREKHEDSYRPLSKDATLTLQPGQFAYLITRETVTLPPSALGFINIDTHTKLKGLINISGFHVDPGYSGRLVFTVFNASPSHITIYEGQRMFRMWLSDFDGPPTESKTKYLTLQRDLGDRLQGTQPSPFSLARKMDDLERQVADLKSQRNQLAFAVFGAAIFLLPFVASLYGSFFATLFPKWSSDIAAFVYGHTFQTAPETQKITIPPASLPPGPAASSLSTSAKPDAATPPK